MYLDSIELIRRVERGERIPASDATTERTLYEMEEKRMYGVWSTVLEYM